MADPFDLESMEPLPTAEVLAVLNEQYGRPAPAFAVILQAMKVNLWANMQASGLFPDDRFKPAGYIYAGEELPKGEGPVIIVGGSVSTEAFGVGWQDSNIIQVTAAFPGAPITRRQFEVSMDTACVIRGILGHPQFQGPYRVNGMRVWNTLYSQGLGLVPATWPHYQGWLARFSMEQPPQAALWPQQ